MFEGDSTKASENLAVVTQGTIGSGESTYWFFVWGGIAVAGALFGMLLGLADSAKQGFWSVIFGAAIFETVLGAIVGFLLAGIVAVPVVLTMATASWALGARRLRAFLTIITGSATGILSTLPIAANSEDFGFRSAATGIAIATFAGLLGSLGGWVAALAWARLVGPVGGGIGRDEAPVANRFLRMGVLMAVIGIDVVACLGVTHRFQQSREAARRAQCSNSLKQIALCLQNYEVAHDSLPPAYTTDKTGNPALSWRVTAARYYFYETDFSERMDLSQPWNSSKNAKFLGGLHAGSFVHCPSSGKNRENPLTDYVAVVGPDTLWPGKLPGDLKKHPKGILVVEWPKSDIHWAEPRDITVEEFLDWFRTKPPGRGFWDWLLAKPPDHDSFHPGCLLYVDAEGKVGELRNDTDPETVRKLLAGQPSSLPALQFPARR